MHQRAYIDPSRGNLFRRSIKGCAEIPAHLLVVTGDCFVLKKLLLKAWSAVQHSPLAHVEHNITFTSQIFYWNIRRIPRSAECRRGLEMESILQMRNAIYINNPQSPLPPVPPFRFVFAS